MTPVLSQLDRLQSVAGQANSALAYMHIDKWKADSSSKQQAQSNADSIQRNLTQALPALIVAVRNAPQDVGAEFKLYRNLNALYDVFASLTESAGAFGPHGDYDALLQQLGVIDSVRRSLGDSSGEPDHCYPIRADPTPHTGAYAAAESCGDAGGWSQEGGRRRQRASQEDDDAQEKACAVNISRFRQLGIDDVGHGRQRSREAAIGDHCRRSS